MGTKKARTMSESCPSCGVPWEKHTGIALKGVEL